MSDYMKISRNELITFVILLIYCKCVRLRQPRLFWTSPAGVKIVPWLIRSRFFLSIFWKTFFALGFCGQLRLFLKTLFLGSNSSLIGFLYFCEPTSWCLYRSSQVNFCLILKSHPVSCRGNLLCVFCCSILVQRRQFWYHLYHWSNIDESCNSTLRRTQWNCKAHHTVKNIRQSHIGLWKRHRKNMGQ